MVTPPKFLESLVRRLLPPAVREQVLGDLQERYQSPLGYIADAASVVPAAIFGQLRRSTLIPFRVLEALIIYTSIFAGARVPFEFDRAPDPSQMVLLTMVALAGLVWHDIYYVRPPELEVITELKRDFPWLKWIPLRPLRELYTAMFLPYLVLLSVGLFWPGVRSLLSLPHGMNILGLLIASTLIYLLRKRIGKRRPSVGT
jgi:hypothetical protein